MTDQIRDGRTQLPPRGGAYQNVLVAILFAAFGFVFFDRLALNYLSPFFKDELGINNAMLGLLGGIPALTWALSGLFIGVLSDKLDRRKPLLVIMVLAFSCFSALSGLVGGIASLLMVRAVMGVAEGGVLPISQTLVLYSSSEKRRGLNMGLVQGSSAGLLGGVVGPIVTVSMAEAWGWRSAFLFTIVPGLIITLLILFLVKELRLKTTVDEAGAPGEEHIAAPTSSIPIAERPATFGEALRNRNVILCVVIAVFFITWFITTQTFTPVYLAEVKGFDAGQIQLVLIGIGLGWVLWGAFVPAFSDRLGRRTTIVIFAFIATLAPLAIIWVDSPGWLFATMILTYTGMGCFTLYMATIPAETVSPRIVGSILGLIMGVGEIGGGFIAPAIGGVIADNVGLDATFLMCSAASLVVFGLAFFLRETSPRVARRHDRQPEGTLR
ncbi:MFS transporter [Brevibacterium aurantiacum]|uniref:MFS transporter n=1 Tax=Brevibacterium aurantiacum TaxID=273384 RepID=UPI001867C8F2|nr:MFS transporter [Brevibacterium aurantiacum]